MLEGLFLKEIKTNNQTWENAIECQIFEWHLFDSMYNVVDHHASMSIVEPTIPEHG